MQFKSTINQHQFAEDLRTIREAGKLGDLVLAMSDELLVIASRLADDGLPPEKPAEDGLNIDLLSALSVFGQTIVGGLEAAVEGIADDIRRDTDGEQSQAEIDEEHRRDDARDRVRDINS